MTNTVRRLGLGVGALVIALGMGAAACASIQNTAPAAGSFPGRQGRMGGGLGPLRMIAARLGLTDAQKSQIKTIMQSHGEEWKDLAARAATARKALHDAVTADAIDDNAIRQASAGVAAVEADAAVARAHARAEVFQVLTPEQQAQARQMQARMQQRFGRLHDRLQERLSK